MVRFFIQSLLIICALFFASAGIVSAQNQKKSVPAGYYQCTSKQGSVIVQCDNKGGGLLGGLSQECVCCGNCKLSSFQEFAVIVANAILGLTGSVALGAFVYGGFIWVTSGGNSDRITKGKQILTGAVIGVIIVLGAWLIVDFVLETIKGTKSNGLG